jgi:succinate dehydrogenase / fumarate reductase iron-sulfur subunit
LSQKKEHIKEVMMSDTRKVTLKAFRFNAETDYLPYYKNYEMVVGKDELILDLLNRIKWEHDGSFSYRRSCRHGMIIDKKDFWDKHAAVKPYVVADVEAHPEHETKQSIAEFDNFLDSDLCIQCGACHYSCPALEVNDQFFGPAAFVSAYRFTVDTRDTAGDERLELTFQGGQGVWDCVKCFECAEACPKEINPIEKITKLHNLQFEKGIARSNIATRHAEGFVRSIRKHGFLDEADIVVYSEGYLGMYKHLKTAVKMMKVGKIHWQDGVPFIDNMPKIKNLDEVQKLIDISMTNKL